jgi:hypothetical protein
MRPSDFHALSERKLFGEGSIQILTKDTDMASGTIYRVWYGKRWGIPQSFKDNDDFDGAASFATLIVADRIEVIR